MAISLLWGASHSKAKYSAGGFLLRRPWRRSQGLVCDRLRFFHDAPAVFRFTASACPERHLEAAAALGVDTAHRNPADAGKIPADRLFEIMAVSKCRAV